MRSALSVVGMLFEERRSRLVVLAVLLVLMMLVEAAGTALVIGLVAALASGEMDLPVVGTVTVGEGGFTRYAITVAVFFAVSGVATILQDLYFHRVMYREGAHLEERMMRGYLSLPSDDAARRDPGELARNVHDTAITVLEGTVIPTIGLVAELVKVVAVVTVMFVVSPLPSLALVVVVVPVLAAVFRVVNPVVHRLGEDVERQLAESLAVVDETFDLAPEIRSAGAVDRFAHRFGEVRMKLARAVGTEETLQGVPRVAAEVALIGFVVGYIVWATNGNETDTDVLTTLGVFAYAALRVLPAMVEVVGLVQSIRFTRPAAEALLADADLFAAQPSSSTTGTGRTPWPARAVTLAAVSYRHPGGSRDALDGVDLVLTPGEVIAVVGPNGSGKSTLLGIVTGQIAPTSGALRVDGESVLDDAVSRDRWVRSVGLAAQRVNLLDADVVGNVTMLDDSVSGDDRRLADVLARSGMDDVVAELPDGARTRLGPGGRRLSGGQRQRVALARALFRDCPVVVFDEATSALDDAARTDVVARLTVPDPDRLALFVTHDPDLARRCTRVVVLEAGRVVADGPPAAVLTPDVVRRSVEERGD